MMNIINYLVLPSQQTDFEKSYLDRMNRTAFWFLMAHIPVFTLIGYANDTGALLAFVLTSLTLVGPVIASKVLASRRSVSTVYGITTMLLGGLLAHFGQGPVQIEMHFYFFVLLALLAVFANPMVIIAAAVTAALHHAGLWLVLPSSVFNYDAPFWVVAIHAAFVVLESVAACFIARSFFDNVIGLEKIVAKRTVQLEQRNNDMQMLLDSVEQGFFTINELGQMSEERSKAVAELLGTVDSNRFVDLVAQHDESAADWIDLGLEDVFFGLLPTEVTIDQLPKRCRTEDKILSIEYSPVMSGDQVVSLAIVISDVTAEVQREKLEVENREMLAVIDKIASDRSGFLEFLHEAEGIINALREESRDDIALVKRRVHTLKGNASIFGLVRVADACHVIEDHISENNEIPEGSEWTELFGSWASTRGNLRRLINESADSNIGITDQEYVDLLADILNSRSRDELARRVAAWKLEPTGARLKRISDQARGLAGRLGKGEINVKCNGGNLRLEPEHWAPFWSAFVHVVRNAVDHGLESPEDRRVAGKSETGNMEINTSLNKKEFVIAISDDGAGIKWEAVRAKAIEHGLPVDTQEDLIESLYQDGMSTAEVVTETSGRGVGMGAMREICREMRGRIEIESQEGQGTTFRFCFPVEKMAPNTFRQLQVYKIASPESVVCCEDNGVCQAEVELSSGSPDQQQGAESAS